MFSVGFLLLTARSVHISGGTQYGISIVGGVVAVQQPPYQVWIAGVVFLGSSTAMVHPNGVFGDCCWWFWWTVVYIGKQVTHYVGRALEKDRGRTFPVMNRTSDDRGPRSTCKCTSHPLINYTFSFPSINYKSL
jgi:hypothetical protein